MPALAQAAELERRVVVVAVRDASQPPDPVWLQLQQANPNDLRVLGLCIPGETPEVADFLEQIGPIQSLPLSLLVNRQGEIIYRHSGPPDEQFRAALRNELSSR
ncbi:MAG: hypothetical protein J0I12_24060 [Candidatus Eremiobacteraeota bacterium]|nr:hypothetical protein [Candidatus Eremiobacteraeota bacterium]